MSERRVIVTGASAGIGLAVSERLAADGWQVVGIARRFDGRAFGPFARTLATDLADIDALDGFCRTLAREEAGVTALVCCAGIGRFAPLESLPLSDLRAQLDLNVLSPMILARAFVPAFKTRRAGDFVFIGSQAAHQPGPRGTAYCASKFALRGFALSLRVECAPRNVRVSLVQPGMTQTGFYHGQGFAPGGEDEAHLRATDCAEAVALVLSAPPGTVYDEIRLSPLRHRIDFDPG